MRIALIPVFISCVAVLVFLGLYPIREKIGEANTVKINEAAQVLTQVMNAANGVIPQSVFEDSLAIVVVPSMFKKSILFNRGYGEGIMLRREEDDAWSNPVFIDFVESDAGLDRNARPSDAILVLRSRKVLKLLERDNLILGKDVSIASGPVGSDAIAQVDEEKPEVYYYTRMQGKLTDISLTGAVLRVDDEANKDFYGSSSVNLEESVSRVKSQAPHAVNKYACLVARYVGSAQEC